MSKERNVPSKTLEGQSQADAFVYDFLYQDVRRVGSYLAQFVPSGHLQSIKQITGAEQSEQSESGASAMANAVVARAQGQFTDRVGSVSRDGMERTYDPLWINAIDLLNLLEDRGFIQRDLAKARIGQIVLATGALGILDLAVLQAIWNVPIFRELADKGIVTGLTESFNKAGTKAENAQARQVQAELMKRFKGVIDLVSKLPHTTQARIATKQGLLVFASLQENGLSTTTSDLILKNGSVVDGEWSMLGVLDALPDQEDPNRDAKIAALGIDSSPFSSIVNSLGPLIRQLGRPEHALGMTPILIFRVVGS